MATYGGRSHGAHLTSDLGGLERELSSRLELEHTVLEQRAQELRRESRKQARQRAFLREERKRAREDRERIEKDEERLKHREKDDWFPKDYLERVPTRRLRVNVGGQIFEVGCDKLGADPDSLLAALAADDCPLFKGAAGGSKVAYVDRDWWTFRHVLAFLRDGVLPASPSLALPLYREAAFWRLDSLKRAVEETHLHLTRTAITVDDDGKLEEKKLDKKDRFWLDKPNWWESQAKKEDAKEDKKDWWKDRDDYRGSRYPLSTDPDKVTATKDDVKSDKNVYPMLQSTWGYYH